MHLKSTLILMFFFHSTTTNLLYLLLSRDELLSIPCIDHASGGSNMWKRRILRANFATYDTGIVLRDPCPTRVNLHYSCFTSCPDSPRQFNTIEKHWRIDWILILTDYRYYAGIQATPLINRLILKCNKLKKSQCPVYQQVSGCRHPFWCKFSL